MQKSSTSERAHVYASVGVHAGVEITLAVERHGGIGASIHIGQDGPDLAMDFADIDSLERLAAVATDGGASAPRQGRRERARPHGRALVSRRRAVAVLVAGVAFAVALAVLALPDSGRLEPLTTPAPPTGGHDRAGTRRRP